MKRDLLAAVREAFQPEDVYWVAGGGLRTSQVCRATGVTYRALDYWARTGLVSPTVPADGSGNYRLWSWEDVRQVAAVQMAREAGVSMVRIRQLSPIVAIRSQIEELQSALEVLDVWLLEEPDGSPSMRVEA